MYRANGHNGEVRASNRVPLPDRSISAEEALWLGHARWADTHNLINWMENTYGYNHQFAR